MCSRFFGQIASTALTLSLEEGEDVSVFPGWVLIEGQFSGVEKELAVEIYVRRTVYRGFGST